MSQNETDKKFFALGMRKFWIAIIVCVLIWSSVFFLSWKKGTALQTDPCSLCAEFMGKNVYCTTQTGIPLTRIYTTDGKISNLFVNDSYTIRNNPA